MITQETKAGMLRAADACEAAGMRHATKMLRMVAERPDATDDEAERWLSRCSFAADCEFFDRLDSDMPNAKLADAASKVCADEDVASMARRHATVRAA